MIETYILLGMVTIVVVCIYAVFKISKLYGEEEKEHEIAQADLEAIKEGKKAKEVISKLSDAELDKQLRDSL